jgi:hypothetical protein
MPVTFLGMAAEGEQRNSNSRGHWIGLASAVIVATITAITAVLVAGIDTGSTPPPPTTSAPNTASPGVSINAPRYGELVGYPTTVEGKMTGRTLKSNEEIWVGKREKDGRFHPLREPCTIWVDRTFRCSDVYLGRLADVNQDYTACALLVSDATQFRSYAARPSGDYSGVVVDPEPVIDESCVSVRR